MPDIFAYTDYRKFLADYYTEHKGAKPGFSYQAFANRAGFPNRGFLYNVIAGGKSLSRSGAIKLSQAMNLGPAEADYFENLVSFTQAKILKERNYFFDKLNAIKSSRPGSAAVREVRKEQHDFYSTWYIGAIRSLIDMHPFRDNYNRLAKAVYPPIRPTEARKAVALLQKLGMIKKGRDGTFAIAEKTITAGREIAQLGISNFQRQTTELALKAIQDLPKDKRNISGLTMGISRKTYETVCGEIAAFQSKLQALAERDNDADNVYQLNFHFFPLSNVNGIATGRSPEQRNKQ
jgi:uncharacterized protein (TIGR02147 family)